MRQELPSLVFRPRARLARQLGEELITDDVIAVFELVKNAYDADATEVKISLVDIKRPGGKIVICDNGHGMTYEDISSKWMEPGTDHKRIKRLSPGGRPMLGEKGIGRFAADKLASRLLIQTKKRGDSALVHVNIDWDAYNEARYLDEVECEAWTTVADPDTHGARLEMWPVRNPWTERRVEALYLNLQSLLPPGSESKNFKIHLDCVDFPWYSGDISGLDPDEATAKLEVHLTEDGTLVRLIDGVELEPEELGALDCGPLSIHLYYFSPPARSRWATRTRAKWNEWAGVRVYRDGLRVLPYGKAGNDWLELNELQSKKFGKYLAVRDLLGYVSITRSGNPLLVDTTSREGLLENNAFLAMREFVRDQVIFLSNHVAYMRKRPERNPGGRTEPKGGKHQGSLESPSHTNSGGVSTLTVSSPRRTGGMSFPEAASRSASVFSEEKSWGTSSSRGTAVGESAVASDQNQSSLRKRIEMLRSQLELMRTAHENARPIEFLEAFRAAQINIQDILRQL